MRNVEILRIYQNTPGLYERAVCELIKYYTPAAGVYVDCGAHIGEHTKNMLCRPDATIIYAIEAIPSLASYLHATFLHQPRVKIIQSAIGKTVGSIDFNVAEDAKGYSGIFKRDLPAVQSWERISVPLITLDSLLLESGSASDVGFIKLDLEGGEFDALLGGRRIIIDNKPFIVFENGLSASANLYGYGRDEFLRFFDSLGYVVFDFFGNLVDIKYWDATLQTYMFVAVPMNSEISHWFLNHGLRIVESVASATA